MKLFRLNRLFNGKSRRCFDVAIDHGFFNELGFLGGIEDLQKAVETLVGANPDAIQLTAGQAEVLQRIPGKGKPALVLVRGGGKVEDLEILRRTEQLIGQGVAGIVYGRNVIQHGNPAGMTQALMAIVHEGATAEEARRFLSPKVGKV
jgi:DhnA family fructose-bisphosphate aldolase class Ia